MTDAPLPPRTIDREIDRLMTDVTERMLRGDAKDYVAYGVLVARYRVLVELKGFLTEQRQQGDPLDED